MQDGVLWTNLTRSEIAVGLQECGFPASVTVVDRLLDAFELGQRQAAEDKNHAKASGSQ